MVKAGQQTLDQFVSRVKTRLLKHYPALEFEVVTWNDRDATIYYRPYSEEDEYPIVRLAGGIATDALVEHGYHIYVIPSPKEQA